MLDYRVPSSSLVTKGTFQPRDHQSILSWAPIGEWRGMITPCVWNAPRKGYSPTLAVIGFHSFQVNNRWFPMVSNEILQVPMKSYELIGSYGKRDLESNITIWYWIHLQPFLFQGSNASMTSGSCREDLGCVSCDHTYIYTYTEQIFWFVNRL